MIMMLLVYAMFVLQKVIDFIPGGYRYMGHNKHGFLGHKLRELLAQIS